ncbi:phosphatidate cytidylyltransferase, partial [Thioclava sp. BHET1]
MSSSSNWTDLRTRSLSGVILAAMGLALIFAGGLWFAALAVVAAGLMLWELAAMMGASTFRARIIGVLGTLCSAFALLHLLPWAGLTLLVPLILGAGFVRREGIVFFIYGGAILVAAYVGVSFLTVFGPLWLIWLICVVVATDVFGYFAGRLIG